MKPVVVGCRTENFSKEQIETFKQHQPFGMIVFAEPCKAGPETVKHVVTQFMNVCPHGRIFMDAEGGRVNRLKPEFGHGWRDVPAARDFAALAKKDLTAACEAIYLNAQLIAHDLVELGINVNCAPVVDLVRDDVMTARTVEGKAHATSASLFMRSFGDDPDIVSACARAYADGLHSMGVTSVLKHAPGYGRVATDPHYGLDKIRVTLDEMLKTDLVPYLRLKDYPAIMTGHTVYENIDPDYPATLSKTMMGIMRNHVGFNGVIIADIRDKETS
jgi:beta-N-acetylhexosaminidase